MNRDGVRSVERLAREGGTSLLWPRFENRPGRWGPWRIEDITLFGRVVDDRTSESWLRSRSAGWSPVLPIRKDEGGTVASIWRDVGGSVFIPFDPDESIVSVWSESYRLHADDHAGERVRRAFVRSYYRVRPFIPRSGQIWLRRRFARIQGRSRFPAWPVETALHDLYALLLGILADVAGEPMPTIASWPRGYDWTLVLTHDVETAVGYERIAPICELEEELGYRSSWNLVPKRYRISDEDVRRLKNAGFEIGVHGLYHDGRDLESLEVVRRRLPAIREYADRWRATGFRAPAMHRNWEWMPLLGFDYDSSYPDTDPYEPQPGGCCSWLPYPNGDVVELPVTLPQDHTLFVILGHGDESAWVQKAEFLKARKGMALLITHPDYFHHEPLARAYKALLQQYASDERAWKPVPREVSAWWRRRGSSVAERSDADWTVVGPAADEATISLVSPNRILDAYAA